MIVRRPQVPLERIDVSAYRIPADAPEADGTLDWDSTTLVLVAAYGGGRKGLGYTYGNVAAARLIDDKLGPALIGRDAFAVPASWQTMVELIRNSGRPGLCSMAVAAVDIALWDLKARLLDLPLVELLGAARAAVPVYGSGGFTSYGPGRLQAQLGRWSERGISAVKIKVGGEAGIEAERVRLARDAVGRNVSLFVDANGAYQRKQALAMAELFADHGVTWLEESVSSDDLEGLRLVRDRGPSGMDVAAGEYGYDVFYFRRMLEAGAVDVLQVDATRCGGMTGFMRAAAVAEAFSLPVSAHTAPSIHAHAACALPKIRPIEYFHDHARIESMLFDGFVEPVGGAMAPDAARPGLGLDLRERDAARYLI